MADTAKGEGYRGMSGAQKAAILMLALGEEQCSRLFGMMHEDEIKDISAAMAQLGSVRAEMVERLCVDFVESIGSSGNLIGSYESTERLLQKALPRDRVAQIMEEIRGPAGRTMWDKLGNVNESGAGELSEERISADGRRGAVQDAPGSCGARADAAAGFVRHGSGDAHAAHGERAERRAGRRRDARCGRSSCPTSPAARAATRTR